MRIFSQRKSRHHENYKITETNSILSAPAASLDRIAIYLRRQYSPVIISPENKNEFIEELQSINPDITKI